MKILNYVKENYLLIGILALAAVLRVYHADFQSIWYDEIHTMLQADPNLTLKQFDDVIMYREYIPHFYFFLLRWLFIIFGYSTMTARLFSAVIGIAGVYAVYLLAREAFSRKAGLIAALLITVNFFHISYSQEARPYGLLFLLTVLSFYRLIIFIRNPTLRNGIFYGIFTGLFVNAHFFGIITVFAQCLILLYFVFKTPLPADRKVFLKNAAISGGVAFLLFLPALRVFLKVSTISAHWIPIPGEDVYTVMFKDFLGHSESVIYIFGLFFIFYLINLLNVANDNTETKDIVSDKMTFSFFIFFVWLIVSLALPLAKSHLGVPMIWNRYFINVLPILIVVVAIGISLTRNKLVQICAVSTIVLFSMIDVVVVKKYYRQVNKTQFREATNFILENNKGKLPVYTSYGWHMGYFLNPEKGSSLPVEKPFETLVSEMINDSTLVKPFWYLDGHLKPLALSPASQAFVDSHFYIQDNYNGYDVWTKHYVLKTAANSSVDIKKFMPLKPVNGNAFNYTIETFENGPDGIKASGWAYFEGQDASSTRINVILIGDGTVSPLQTQSVQRDDISAYFKSKFDLSHAGFSAALTPDGFGKGKYQVGILLKDDTTGKEGLVLTDKYVEK
jgi:hypothetical protein